MPHQAVNDGYILTELTSIKLFSVPRTSPVVAPLTADAEKGDQELTFLKTGFDEGDYVLVGSGLSQSAYPLGEIPADSSPIPIDRPADFDHASGDLVKLLAEHHLGYIEDGGATFGGSSTQTSISAANARGNIYTTPASMGDLTCSWGERAASLEILALAYGLDVGRVEGSGGAGDPKRLMVHPDTMLEMRDFFILLEGPLKNGLIRRRALFNPTITANISGAFGAKNAPMVVPVSCIYTHHLDWDAAA